MTRLAPCSGPAAVVTRCNLIWLITENNRDTNSDLLGSGSQLGPWICPSHTDGQGCVSVISSSCARGTVINSVGAGRGARSVLLTLVAVLCMSS